MTKRAQPTDEIAIGPEVSPGVHSALRRQNGEVSEVYVRMRKEGEPINPENEFARLGPSSCECDGGHWRELTSIHKPMSGPAQVATPEYRKGYDRIFGKQKVGLA